MVDYSVLLPVTAVSSRWQPVACGGRLCTDLLRGQSNNFIVFLLLKNILCLCKQSSNLFELREPFFVFASSFNLQLPCGPHILVGPVSGAESTIGKSTEDYSVNSALFHGVEISVQSAEQIR